MVSSVQFSAAQPSFGQRALPAKQVQFGGPWQKDLAKVAAVDAGAAAGVGAFAGTKALVATEFIKDAWAAIAAFPGTVWGAFTGGLAKIATGTGLAAAGATDAALTGGLVTLSALAGGALALPIVRKFTGDA